MAAALKLGDRIGGVAGTEVLFEPCDDDIRQVDERPCSFQASSKGRHAGCGLERILRRDKPPDFIEVEPLQGRAADKKMAVVGRVKGTAEQADAAARGMVQKREMRGQDRVCPLPRTRYFMVVS